MLYFHVTIFTVGKTSSANKDFEWALVEETSKTLTDFSGELDVGFVFFQRLLSISEAEPLDDASFRLFWDWCEQTAWACGRTSPQLQNPCGNNCHKTLLCAACIWNKLQNAQHIIRRYCWDKRRGKLKTIFWFSPLLFRTH